MSTLQDTHKRSNIMTKTIDFGTVGVAGDTVSWKGILDDATIGAGNTTQFHLEVTRPAADGALAAPGLSVYVLLFPALGNDVTIDAPGIAFPGGSIGVDTGNALAAGETSSIDFQITNDPAGATPAAYTMLSVVSWPGGFFVSPLFTAP
jgi:hypothetical protein